MVLLHELAHVQATGLLDTATGAVVLCRVLVQPAVMVGVDANDWWNGRGRAMTWCCYRESRPSEYAGHLLAVAREQRRERGLSVVAVAMARTANLEGRLRAILDARATPRRLSRCDCGVRLAGCRAPSSCRSPACASKRSGRRSTGVRHSRKQAESTVRGRVIDAAGQARRRCTAWCVWPRYFRRLTSSYENTIVKGQGSADDQGRFRLDLPRVPDGDKTLVVTAPGLGSRVQ